MRRYELMMILRPDVADDRSKAIFDRTVRSITESGGSVFKTVPWGRRRMAYEIDGCRDGIYQIYQFESPASAIALAIVATCTECACHASRSAAPRPGQRPGSITWAVNIRACSRSIPT